MVTQWSLSESKSPQVPRTLLSILAYLNNAVFWMVSTRPLTSKSSSPGTNPLVTVTAEPITIGITVTFMFHSFSVLWLGLGTYLSFHFLSVLPCSQLGQQSPLFGKFSSFFFFLTITRFGRLVEIR